MESKGSVTVIRAVAATLIMTIPSKTTTKVKAYGLPSGVGRLPHPSIQPRSAAGPSTPS
jgi:hypothetical protein